jgi:hypothetical protein
MKLIIEIDLDKENWEPTTAQVRTVLRRTANRLEQKLPCVGLEQPIVNDEEIVIGKWGIFEKERIMAERTKDFQDGQKLRTIHFTDGEYVSAESSNVEAIEIVFENGQMAGVPWALVTHKDGTQNKWNLALCQGVTLPPKVED